MRTETVIKTYKTFNELTEKEQAKAAELFVASDLDLYEHCMRERIATLKVITDILGGTLDYSLSCVPSRGEFITIKPSEHEELDFQALHDVIDDDCPFTGVCYDEDFKVGFLESANSSEIEALNHALNEYIKSIHNEYEAMCKVEYIGELCEANGYEFDADSLELV